MNNKDACRDYSTLVIFHAYKAYSSQGNYLQLDQIESYVYLLVISNLVWVSIMRTTPSVNNFNFFLPKLTRKLLINVCLKLTFNVLIILKLLQNFQYLSLTVAAVSRNREHVEKK